MVSAESLQTIGKYQVIERIATGDLAEIFLARLEGIGGFRRLFAIKRVLPHLAHNVSYAQMIEEEARIAGILSHGNIVQLLDLGRDEGVLYLVMEYVDGWDLGKVLSAMAARTIDMPVRHAIFLGMQLLKGLEYAHGRTVMKDGERAQLDLVHRDVSPSNILLSRQGDVKLTDFGIARASLKMMETHPDLVARRFDYISPEQAKGEEITQAADMWAVAVVMYQVLTGVHPFRREGEFDTIEAICDGAFTPLSERREIPPMLEEVLNRALSLDPASRPESATAFKDTLAQIRHDLGGSFTEDRLASWLEMLFSEEGDAEEDSAEQEDEVVEASEPEEAGEVEEAEEPEPAPPIPAKMPSSDHDEEIHTVVVAVPEPVKKAVAAKQAATAAVADVAKPAILTPKAQQAADADEAATVVNRDLAERLEDLKEFKEGADGHADDEATRVRSAALRNLQKEAGIGQPTIVHAPAVDNRAQNLMILLLGVMLGSVLMVVVGRSGGMAINPPMLDVQGAPDLRMKVTVDEMVIDGPTTLDAGNHRVRVDVEGSEPWEVDLSLQAGEYRLMMIEADRLQPKEEEAEPE